MTSGSAQTRRRGTAAGERQGRGELVEGHLLAVVGVHGLGVTERRASSGLCMPSCWSHVPNIVRSRPHSRKPVFCEKWHPHSGRIYSSPAARFLPCSSMAAPVPFTPLVVDGQERPSADSQSFEVYTPQSGNLVGTAAAATSQDCRDAIDAAARALKSWEQTSPVERRNIFLKAADILASEPWTKLLQEANRQEVAFSPYWCTFDSVAPVNYLRAQAGLVDRLRGEFYPSISVPGAQVHVHPRAKGVLYVLPLSFHRSDYLSPNRLAIAPWNAPAVLTVRAVAIPIFCGNTVVLKGSELTPRTHYLVTKAFHEAGLPPGVLNCISTAPSTTPSLVSEIIAHPQVRHINVSEPTPLIFNKSPFSFNLVHWKRPRWKNYCYGSCQTSQTLCS